MLLMLFVLSRAKITFSVYNNSSSCMTDNNSVVGLPYVVTNELEQLLRRACGEGAAQALVPILIFMRTNAPVSEIIKSHAQHLPGVEGSAVI